MNLPPDPGIVLPVTMHHNVVGYQQHGQLIFVRSPITNQGQPVIFQDMQVNPLASVSSCQGEENVHIEEQLKEVSSSEEKIKIFQTVLMDVVDKVVPKINTHKLNHKVTKWWNETCTKAKQDLKDAKSNYERLPTFHGYVEYQRKAAEFKKTVIAAKRESWINFLNKLDFRVPASRVYSTVKSLISGSREDQTNPPITYKNSTLVTDQEIAEAAVSLLDSVIGVPYPLSDCEIEVKAKVKRFSKSHRSVAYNQPFLTQEIEDMIFPQFVKALLKKLGCCFIKYHK
ncbi:hypothetical protein QYM36_012852 [Artemia franciscana]|uniref:Uncharacterized protein n=1 Tax=Artemia franciscana TaxID=6661 RepID=A0AA88L8B6_ARTSF|nr:hypothetical protein QYM36_012852 [Artemia franciscana]